MTIRFAVYREEQISAKAVTRTLAYECTTYEDAVKMADLCVGAFTAGIVVDRLASGSYISKQIHYDKETGK